MIKRALAATLCLMLVFALLPKTARADNPSKVKINGVELANNQYYINGKSSSESTEPSNWNAHYKDGVLTLRDLNVVGCSVPNGGINASANDNDLLTIKLEGENIVSMDENCGCAIFIQTCSLSIDGTGSLSATGGYDKDGIYAGHGINVGKNLTMAGGSVKGTGGTSDDADSYGIVAAGDLTVEGGTLTGVGGTGTRSYGVKASTIFVKGGSSKGTGGKASVANGSIGFQCGTISIGRNIEFRFEGKGDTALGANGYATQYSQVPYWRIEEDGGYTQSNRWGDYISDQNMPPYLDVRSALPTTPSIKVSVPAFGMMQAPENETVTVNSDDGINATDNFLSAQMDNKTIDLGSVETPGADGSVSNGSIVIHLNKAYLDKLSAGTHTLRVNLTGVYAGMFVEAQIAVQSSGGGIGAGGDVGPDVPKTGDAATPALWLGLMLLAGAGLAVSAVRRRKRQNG